MSKVRQVILDEAFLVVLTLFYVLSLHQAERLKMLNLHKTSGFP